MVVMSSYDERLREIEDSESHYLWRCPFDSLECHRSVKRLRFGACYLPIFNSRFEVENLEFVCARFDMKVDVFRCRDGLPCNKFVVGCGFGACRDKDFGGKVRVCCSRFRPMK